MKKGGKECSRGNWKVDVGLRSWWACLGVVLDVLDGTREGVRVVED